MELLGVTWDLDVRPVLRVLVVPNRGLEGWRDSFTGDAIDAVGDWVECLETFSEHYGYNYVRKLRFEVVVEGLNTTYQEHDITLSWVGSFPPATHVGETYLTTSSDGRIQKTRIYLPVSISERGSARPVSDIEMRNLVAEEIGHALGLGHSNVKGDLMFGFHVSGEKILCHSTLNIYGLAVLYGYTHESGATSMHRQVVTLRETSIPYSSVDSLEH